MHTYKKKLGFAEAEIQSLEETDYLLTCGDFFGA
jgi:hypothetical protein